MSFQRQKTLPPEVLIPLIPLPFPESFNLEYVPPIESTTEVPNERFDKESIDWHDMPKNAVSNGINEANDICQVQ